MERISLADLPRNARGNGDPMQIAPRTRTEKSGGIDISGDATMEMYRRMRDRQAAAEAERQARQNRFSLRRILGRAD